MAGLEKYEASEEWKNKFKKLLFMDRKTVQKTSETIIESQRYSMDIGADLQNILKEKNIPYLTNTPKSSKKTLRYENKENDRIHLKDFRNSVDMADDTIQCELEKSQNQQDISDESFEAMEKICNKTASDPDSTLFKYIHSDNKRGIIEETKKRLSAISDFPGEECEDEEEAAAVERLLNDFQQNNDSENQRKTNEMTQIEDIEEPSQFWDSTIVQTSPVKMVGLLRPSTIIEEACGYDESDASSSAQTSYRSALKALPSEISSSCYETASETVSTQNACDPLYIKDFKIEYSEVEPLSLQENNLIDINESKNLIDFENPTKNIHNYQKNVDDIKSASESDDSVIELLSDEDNPLSPFCKKEEETSPLCDRRSTLIKWETPFNIKIEVSPLSSSEKNSINGSQKVERISLNFNDTLEEVEYMMKKGMELINAQNTAKELDQNVAKELESKAQNWELPSPTILKGRQNTYTKSSTKEKVSSQSAKIEALNPVTTPKRTPSSKPSDDRFALTIKPIPKFDLFKKPTSATKPNNLGARPKDQFAHVVSPIATYVNKTSVTPLMTSVNTKTNNINSRAYRQLEYESQLHKSKSSKFEGIKLEKNPNARTLPRKAYISSEFRQVTDQRSPITIPGGKKIQRYLDSAVTPAVICHDGKAKSSNYTAKLPIKFQKTSESQSNTPKRSENVKDMSLANLSVMSGDVSVYTIRDAQKL